MTRGLVVPLTDAQIVVRALYLAGELAGKALDKYVRTPAAQCPVIYYRLKQYNGGTDPTAPDPATRWHQDEDTRTNVTCDCAGANAWMHGFDRYQPNRMRKSVKYDGAFNTNSKIIDATLPLLPGERRCFVAEPRPFRGGIIVCKSGSPGHDVGHEETMVSVPLEWDPNFRECWDAIQTVGVSNRKDAKGRPSRANMRGTGRGWFRTGALFLRSVMQP